MTMTPRPRFATKHEKDIREMVAARWSQRRIARTFGVAATTVKRSMNALGIVHGGNNWSPREYKTLPIIAELRAARMNQCVTLKDLADRTGWHLSLVNEWERGARRMHAPGLIDVAKALGYDVVLRRRAGT